MMSFVKQKLNYVSPTHVNKYSMRNTDVISCITEFKDF